MFAPAAKGLDRAGSKLGKRRRTEYLDVDYVMPAMPGARIVPAVVSANDVRPLLLPLAGLCSAAMSDCTPIRWIGPPCSLEAGRVCHLPCSSARSLHGLPRGLRCTAGSVCIHTDCCAADALPHSA